MTFASFRSKLGGYYVDDSLSVFIIK